VRRQIDRTRAPTMVNLPWALFDARAGREPRYRISPREAPDWAYLGDDPRGT
jgi:hypothetical protein